MLLVPTGSLLPLIVTSVSWQQKSNTWLKSCLLSRISSGGHGCFSLSVIAWSWKRKKQTLVILNKCYCTMHQAKIYFHKLINCSHITYCIFPARHESCQNSYYMTAVLLYVDCTSLISNNTWTEYQYRNYHYDTCNKFRLFVGLAAIMPTTFPSAFVIYQSPCYSVLLM
jgi:hypothetical protein